MPAGASRLPPVRLAGQLPDFLVAAATRGDRPRHVAGHCGDAGIACVTEAPACLVVPRISQRFLSVRSRVMSTLSIATASAVIGPVH